MCTCLDTDLSESVLRLSPTRGDKCAGNKNNKSDLYAWCCLGKKAGLPLLLMGLSSLAITPYVPFLIWQ